MTSGAGDGGLEVTTEQAAAAIADGSATVIDVREPQEREAGFIPGTIHIPLGSLGEQAASIDRSRPVIFQCRVGARSLMAAQAFQASGFEATSLAGGILAWAAEDRPMEGTVADH